MKQITLNAEEVRVLIPHLDMQSDIAEDTSTDAIWKDLSEYADNDNINITKIEFSKMRHAVDLAITYAINLASIRSALYSNQGGNTFEFSNTEVNSLKDALSSQVHFLEDTIGEDETKSISEQAIELVELVTVFNKIK
jgi:hypothetical protein